jgi:hypothetical protein
MATWQFSAELSSWIAILALVLDARQRDSFPKILAGLLFARGRRTVTSWLRGAGIRKGYDEYYYFLSSLGRKSKEVGGALLQRIVKQLPLDDRLLFGIDDSPTERYGPHVQGAGIHHNPTPGPADQKFLYGHVWVTIAWLWRHPLWGTIALPLRALLYVRQKNIPLLRGLHDWQFRTKLEQAVELMQWVASCLKYVGKSLWVVVDGAYAKRHFLKPMIAAGITVVSRLRKDAALCSVPQQPRPGERRRGRPRKYGAERISLAKRAGQSGGWQTEQFTLYGREMTTRFKTFLATYRPAGGLIRVVLVKNDDGSWVAFFCTDSNASVADILEAVADRSAIEQVFHDVKEVHGAGEQQLRNVWANIAAWNISLWAYTLIELWAWNKSKGILCDRSDSPWDDAERRPSHADRCKALRRECLETELSRHAKTGACSQKILAFLKRLAQRAA